MIRVVSSLAFAAWLAPAPRFCAVFVVYQLNQLPGTLGSAHPMENYAPKCWPPSDNMIVRSSFTKFNKQRN